MSSVAHKRPFKKKNRVGTKRKRPVGNKRSKLRYLMMNSVGHPPTGELLTGPGNSHSQTLSHTYNRATCELMLASTQSSLIAAARHEKILVES